MAVKTKKPKLTEAEKALVKSGCLHPGTDFCPAHREQTSPHTYQKHGCRGDACKALNREYYTNRYAEKKAEAEKRARKRAAARKAKRAAAAGATKTVKYKNAAAR